MRAEIGQVVRVHSSSRPEQLTLENGQLIVILSKNASGWWLGELQVSVDGCCLVAVERRALTYLDLKLFDMIVAALHF